MSFLEKRDDFTDMIELWYTDDEKIGTFQVLNCEVHGDCISFTDKSGTDNCIGCVKAMFKPAQPQQPEATLPTAETETTE